MIITVVLNLFIYSFYFYGSLFRRKIKRKYLLIGLVQDHHVIPYEFRNYIKNSSQIKDIHSSINILMLPTSYGKLFIKTKRPIHENGHIKYNYYVKSLLEIHNIDEVLKILKYQLIKNPDNITKLI